MSDSLTTLISKAQAVLQDDGTLFSTARLTAAARHALLQLNLVLPITGGTLLDTVADQYEYELTSATAGATPTGILDVLLSDPDGGEYDLRLPHQAFNEDNRLFFRLETPQAPDLQMIVRYTAANTINGLDSETESTLTAEADIVLLDGIAAQALRSASAGRVESNNVDPAVSANYIAAAAQFEKAFRAGLATLKARRRMQAAVPQAHAWNDKWHEWPQ